MTTDLSTARDLAVQSLQQALRLRISERVERQQGCIHAVEIGQIGNGLQGPGTDDGQDAEALFMLHGRGNIIGKTQPLRIGRHQPQRVLVHLVGA